MSKPDFSKWHVHITPMIPLEERTRYVVHVFNGRGEWSGARICETRRSARLEARRMRRRLRS